MSHTHVSENFPLQLLADAGAGFTIDIAATAATKVVATRMRLVLTCLPSSWVQLPAKLRAPSRSSQRVPAVSGRRGAGSFRDLDGRLTAAAPVAMLGPRKRHKG